MQVQGTEDLRELPDMSVPAVPLGLAQHRQQGGALSLHPGQGAVRALRERVSGITDDSVQVDDAQPVRPDRPVRQCGELQVVGQGPGGNGVLFVRAVMGGGQGTRVQPDQGVQSVAVVRFTVHEARLDQTGQCLEGSDLRQLRAGGNGAGVEQRIRQQTQQPVQPCLRVGQVLVGEVECTGHAALLTADGAGQSCQALALVGEFVRQGGNGQPGMPAQPQAHDMQGHRQPVAQVDQAVGAARVGLDPPGTGQFGQQPRARSAVQGGQCEQPGAVQGELVQRGSAGGEDRATGAPRRQGGNMASHGDVVQDDQQPPRRAVRAEQRQTLGQRHRHELLGHTQGAQAPGRRLGQVATAVVAAQRGEVDEHLTVRKPVTGQASPPARGRGLPDPGKAAENAHGVLLFQGSFLQPGVQVRELRAAVDEAPGYWDLGGSDRSRLPGFPRMPAGEDNAPMVLPDLDVCAMDSCRRLVGEPAAVLLVLHRTPEL